MKHMQVSAYLAQIREATQWHGNQSVLAPGERTPYLEKVVDTAMASLGLALPEVKIVSIALKTPPTASSNYFREVVALVGDTVFSIEGARHWSEIEDDLIAAFRLNAAANAPLPTLERAAWDASAMEAVLTRKDVVSLKLIGVAQQALSEHIQSPCLREETPPAPNNAPRRSL